MDISPKRKNDGVDSAFAAATERRDDLDYYSGMLRDASWRDSDDFQVVLSALQGTGSKSVLPLLQSFRHELIALDPYGKLVHVTSGGAVSALTAEHLADFRLRGGKGKVNLQRLCDALEMQAGGIRALRESADRFMPDADAAKKRHAALAADIQDALVEQERLYLKKSGAQPVKVLLPPSAATAAQIGGVGVKLISGGSSAVFGMLLLILTVAETSSPADAASKAEAMGYIFAAFVPLLAVYLGIDKARATVERLVVEAYSRVGGIRHGQIDLKTLRGLEIEMPSVYDEEVHLATARLESTDDSGFVELPGGVWLNGDGEIVDGNQSGT